jgi:hypothetical protein
MTAPTASSPAAPRQKALHRDRAREVVLSRLAAAAEPLREAELLRTSGVHVNIARRVLAALVDKGLVLRQGGGKRGSPYLYRLEGK